MVKQIAPEHLNLKVGLLKKKAQNKSSFFTRDSLKERVFVLDSVFLVYYDGTLDTRGSAKGSIGLRDILAVQPVVDKLTPPNGLQISYEEDGRSLILYAFAASLTERDEWIESIRYAALKIGARFSQAYHPACWDKKDGFPCCGAPSRGDEGCTPVTGQVMDTRQHLFYKRSSSGPGEILVDMMSKRSQGKSKFFGLINYKERVFVLSTNDLCYFGGNLKNRDGLKGAVQLSSVLAVEYIRADLLDNRKNAFQVVYEDDDDEVLTLVIVAKSGDKRQTWVANIRNEATNSGANFQSVYHPGIWMKSLGKYTCCGDIARESMGCEPVTVNPGPGHRRENVDEVKVGTLVKKAQCKSSFFVSSSFRKRLFVLSPTELKYFHGTEKKRGDLKCRIPLVNISVVATADQNALKGRKHAFQVVYKDDSNGKTFFLYMIAASSYERNSWLTTIISECKTSGVLLQPSYHPGVWTKMMGKFTCCGQTSREAGGCMENDVDQIIIASSSRPLSSSSSTSLSS